MSNSDRTSSAVVAGADFVPPHCPNLKCAFYVPDADWVWQRYGSFRRQDWTTRFQCFRCVACGRVFSVRTFAPDYWLRLRRLLLPIARLSTEGSGVRQTGRVLGISHSTVQRHLSRAARFALIFQRERLAARPVREPLVVDGFESFEHSQYFPFHLNLAVGAASWFMYGFTDSPLRRKGRMRPEQRIRREQLELRFGRANPKAIETGLLELLRLVIPRGWSPTSALPIREHAAVWSLPASSEETPGFLCVHSDDHPAYPRALRRLEAERGISVAHRVTASRERRTCANPLFPVNLADLLLRHAQANHRRETIAFSKRRQGAISRAALFMFWRNFVKNRREKAPGTSAAMAAGLADRLLRWEDLLTHRRFPRAEVLPGPWWEYYWHRVKTAVLGDKQVEHRAFYAF